MRTIGMTKPLTALAEEAVVEETAAAEEAVVEEESKTSDSKKGAK